MNSYITAAFIDNDKIRGWARQKLLTEGRTRCFVSFTGAERAAAGRDKRRAPTARLRWTHDTAAGLRQSSQLAGSTAGQEVER